MNKTICWDCIDDLHLKQKVKTECSQLICSVCGSGSNNSIPIEELGQMMEPILKEHFAPGPNVKIFGENEANDRWNQEGESMASMVQQVLDQSFGSEIDSQIVDSIIKAEKIYPGDGDAYWDKTTNYIKKPRKNYYFPFWQSALDTLKHQRHFFNPDAQDLFKRVFHDVEELLTYNGHTYEQLVQTLPVGTNLFRGRICNAYSIKDIYNDPYRHVGPPPKEKARAGRMNPEGVVVFYGAMELDTCLAEMRSAIGNELVVITLKTNKPLRVLDFARLANARLGKALSYFQPDFIDQIEKQGFLRHLNRLISKPIIPGREADYLITQTMAEYLAYIHKNPFDGILYSSAQHEGGRNLVLFPEPNRLSMLGRDRYNPVRLSYVPKSVSLFSTKSIVYTHSRLDVTVGTNGVPFIYDNFNGWEEDE